MFSESTASGPTPRPGGATPQPLPELIAAVIPGPSTAPEPAPAPAVTPTTVDPAPDSDAVLWCRDLAMGGGGALSLTLGAGEHRALVCEDPRRRRRVVNALLGLIGPRRGELYVDGVPFHELDEETRDEARAERIGFVLPDLTLVPTLTLLENLTLAPLEADAVPAADARDVLDHVGLGHRADVTADALSDIEELAGRLARALVRRPALVVVDTIAVGAGDEADPLWSILREWGDAYPTAMLFIGPEETLPSWVDHQVSVESVLTS